MAEPEPAGGKKLAMQVKIFTTQLCGFCFRAKRLLESKGIDYEEHSVDGDQDARVKLMQLTGQRTVPQIWVGDQHIGGCDDLYALDRSGRLDSMLAGSA